MDNKDQILETTDAYAENTECLQSAHMKNEVDEALRCPCCGQHFFTEKNAYEICPVCGWEDDKLQRLDPDFEGGANEMSLNLARAAFAAKEAETETWEDYLDEE